MVKLLLFTLMLALSASANSAYHRSTKAKNAFKYSHPCPANGDTKGRCPGYVIDHIIALACGGADSPVNMQWQTVTEGKAKDKWERKECKKH